MFWRYHHHLKILKCFKRNVSYRMSVCTISEKSAYAKTHTNKCLFLQIWNIVYVRIKGELWKHGSLMIIHINMLCWVGRQLHWVYYSQIDSLHYVQVAESLQFVCHYIYHKHINVNCKWGIYLCGANYPMVWEYRPMHYMTFWSSMKTMSQ